MTMFWKLAVTLAVVAFVAAVQPTCVFACTCRRPGPPQEALTNATAVFSGRVTAIRAPADRGGPDPVEVTFAVTQGWKGADQPTVVVDTPGSSASCGVDFVEGEAYLVYASASEGRLQTNLCNRTTQLAMAGEDLAVLGAGSAPSPSTGGSAPTTLPATGNMAALQVQRTAAAGTALLVILLGAVVARRLR